MEASQAGGKAQSTPATSMPSSASKSQVRVAFGAQRVQGPARQCQCASRAEDASGLKCSLPRPERFRAQRRF